MTPQRVAAIALTAATTVLLAGCGGGSSGGTLAASHHKTHPPVTPPPTTPAPLPTTTVTVTAQPTSTTASGAAQNLTISKPVRQQLVAAGAATHELPASDFTGLAPGTTYYAYNPATSTYWAGAALVPSTSSQEAQISVQDDGSYLVFKRKASGSWVGFNVGLAGISGTTCQVTVPAGVLKVWQWKPNTCRPPES